MTDKSKSRDLDISRFSPETVYTIYIAAQPDEVWRALTSA